jgi:acetyl esterase/lipase
MKNAILFVCVAVACGALFAGSEAPVKLWPEGKMPSPQQNQKTEPYLVWHNPEKRTSTAILISVSGGGYMGNGITGFEVAPIRDYFLSKGVTVVTMLYRTPRPQGLPKHLTAWQDAQRTVRLVRAEAVKRGLDPENIGFTGCSAGGHLTLMVATSSQTPAYEPVDEIDKLPCHVNWAVPVYPAYGLVPNSNHAEVKACNDLSAPLVPEFAFDAGTPPMCLVHGDADSWSPMVSVRVYHKLRTMGIPAEMHVMALEPHCFMDDPVDGTPAATWKDRVWEWASKLHIVGGHPRSYSWRDPLAGKLEDVADFEQGVWHRTWRGILTAEKDSALWLKGDYSNFVLDLEYKLDPGANSGVIIYASDVKNWIPNSVEVQLLDDLSDKWKKDPPRLKNGGLYGHVGPEKTSSKPAGMWNRMTIWAKGDRVKVMVNGQVTVDDDLSRYTSAKTNPDGTPIQPWLSKPLAGLPKRGAIGFQGRHGGARPYFRNLRLRALGADETF